MCTLFSSSVCRARGLREIACDTFTFPLKDVGCMEGSLHRCLLVFLYSLFVVALRIRTMSFLSALRRHHSEISVMKQFGS